MSLEMYFLDRNRSTATSFFAYTWHMFGTNHGPQNIGHRGHQRNFSTKKECPADHWLCFTYTRTVTSREYSPLLRYHGLGFLAGTIGLARQLGGCSVVTGLALGFGITGKAVGIRGLSTSRFCRFLVT